MDEGERQSAYYKEVFETEYPTECEVKAAFTKAHEIRQFEINLYWKRSLFFWGFILTFLGGFTFLKRIKQPETDILIAIVALSVLGLFTSFAWRKLEIGAHSWQENWEHHIDFLENGITGKLHKTILGKRSKFYSMNRIHQSFIQAMICFWTIITMLAILNLLNKIFCIQEMSQIYLLISYTVTFIIACKISFLLTTDKIELAGCWRTSDKSLPHKGSPCDVPAIFQRELPNIKFPEK